MGNSCNFDSRTKGGEFSFGDFSLGKGNDMLDDNVQHNDLGFFDRGIFAYNR